MEKINVSDEAALEVFTKQHKSTTKVGTKFVPRTIVYPVVMEYRPGIKTTEIRTFVRMYEYCSPSRWEKALKIEKKYAKLNKAYMEDLERRKKITSAKEPGNPLKATILDVNK